MKKENQLTMIAVTFGVPEKLFGRLNELTNKRDFLSRAECLRWMITEMCDEHLDNYVEIAKKRLAKQSMSPEDKARLIVEREEAVKKAKEDKKWEFLNSICTNDLSGTIGEKNGHPYCFYKTYELTGPDEVTAYDQADPVERMNTELPLYQYRLRNGTVGEEARAFIEKITAKNK